MLRGAGEQNECVGSEALNGGKTAVTNAKVCVIDADKSCSVDAHDPKSPGT
jgi:hypothetical protein